MSDLEQGDTVETRIDVEDEDVVETRVDIAQIDMTGIDVVTS